MVATEHFRKDGDFVIIRRLIPTNVRLVSGGIAARSARPEPARLIVPVKKANVMRAASRGIHGMEFSGLGAAQAFSPGSMTAGRVIAGMPVIPASGLTMTAKTHTGTSLIVLVPPTISTVQPGTGSMRVAPNPDYAPPGAVLETEVIRRLRAGSLKVTWRPPLNAGDKEAWLRNQPASPSMYSIGADSRYPPQPYVYTTDPQAMVNRLAWLAYGQDHGWIKSSWMDKLSDAVGYAVQGIVMAGIGYGAAQAAGQIAAKGITTGAQSGAGAAPASAPVATTPAATTVATAPAAAPVATTATVTTSGGAAASTAATIGGKVLAAGGAAALSAAKTAVANLLGKQQTEMTTAAPGPVTPEAFQPVTAGAGGLDILRKYGPYLLAGMSLFIVLGDGSKKSRRR